MLGIARLLELCEQEPFEVLLFPRNGTAPPQRAFLMSKFKQSQNEQRHQFLLTFFGKEKIEEVKEVNGFILKKYCNGATHEWQVAIYTKESYSRAEDYLQTQSHLASMKPNAVMD